MHHRRSTIADEGTTRQEAAARAEYTVPEFVREVLESCVLAQHAYCRSDVDWPMPARAEKCCYG